MRVDEKVVEFDWDEGNIGKNRKHSVEDSEAEEPFFDENKQSLSSNKVILKDVLHSKDEKRFILLGKTKKGRLLFTVFTKRNRKIRIISARDTNKKEVYLYEERS